MKRRKKADFSGSVFPERVVLCEGYPWAIGLEPYTELAMRNQRMGGVNQRLEWPAILWGADVPRYRLVLERVE